MTRKRGLLLILITVMVGAGGVVVFLRMGSGKPISTRGGLEFKSQVLLQAPFYNQHDPRWAQDTIGSGETIGKAGCTLCCVAMLFSYYGLPTTPKQLNGYLKNNDGYNPRGWLRWQKCAEYGKATCSLVYVGNPDYEVIDANLRQGNPVIVKVLISNILPHWVLIVGKEGHEYLINDPLAAEDTPRRLSCYGAKMYSLRVFQKNV